MVVGVVGFAAALVMHARGLRFNVSPSLPIGVYGVVKGPITRGATVLVCLPRAGADMARIRGYLWRGSCPGEVAPVGKIVVAVAGDVVAVSAIGVSVNASRLPHSAPLAVDRRGRPLPAVRGQWVLQRGELWLYADGDRRSFDSRYFGVVDTANVRAVMRPLVVLQRSLLGMARDDRPDLVR